MVLGITFYVLACSNIMLLLLSWLMVVESFSGFIPSDLMKISNIYLSNCSFLTARVVLAVLEITFYVQACSNIVVVDFFFRFYPVRPYENLKYLRRFRLVQLLIGRSCWGKMGRSCQSQRIYDLEKVPNSKKRLLKVPTKTFPRRLSTLFDLSKWKVDTEGQKGCWG